MVIKYIGIADIHFGSRDVSSLMRELDWFIGECDRLKPDFVVILGDLYDKKVYLHSEASAGASKFVHELHKKYPVYIIHGTLSHDFHQLTAFNHLRGVDFKIYDTLCHDNIHGMNVVVIPEEYVESKEDYYSGLLSEHHDACFGHGMFDFAGSYARFETYKRNKVLFTTSDFKNVSGLVDFGHIHIRVISKNCEYAGSFSRDSFGEEAPKGFLYREYDTSKHKILKKEFIENTLAPIYLTKKTSEIDTSSIFKTLDDLRKTCFRLRIVVDTELDDPILNDLRSYSIANPEVNIERRRILTSEESVRNDKKEARTRELSKYEGLDIYDVTRMMAEEKFGVKIRPEDVTSILNGTY